MGFRGWMGAALIGLALVSPAAAQERCTAEPVTSLPIVMLGGKVLVPVQVNGQIGMFAVDTGGFASAVSATLVERLKLKTYPIRSFMRLSDIGGERANSYAVADQLSIGNQLVKGERYMVAELGPGVDGLLAPDLLRNFDLDFDFAGNQLNLYRPRACAGKPPGTGAFSELGMDVTKQGHIRVPVTLDGKRLMATVDTGASNTYIISGVARANFGVRMSELTAAATGAAGGRVNYTPHDFATLQIGDIVQQTPRVMVMDRDQGFEASPILLGMQQLGGLRLFVSYSSRSLFVSAAR